MTSSLRCCVFSLVVWLLGCGSTKRELIGSYVAPARSDVAKAHDIVPAVQFVDDTYGSHDLYNPGEILSQAKRTIRSERDWGPYRHYWPEFGLIRGNRFSDKLTTWKVSRASVKSGRKLSWPSLAGAGAARVETTTQSSFNFNCFVALAEVISYLDLFRPFVAPKCKHRMTPANVVVVPRFFLTAKTLGEKAASGRSTGMALATRVPLNSGPPALVLDPFFVRLMVETVRDRLALRRAPDNYGLNPRGLQLLRFEFVGGLAVRLNPSGQRAYTRVGTLIRKSPEDMYRTGFVALLVLILHEQSHIDLGHVYRARTDSSEQKRALERQADEHAGELLGTLFRQKRIPGLYACHLTMIEAIAKEVYDFLEAKLKPEGHPPAWKRHQAFCEGLEWSLL